MTTRFITRGTLYTTTTEVFPNNQYDTPKLSRAGWNHDVIDEKSTAQQQQQQQQQQQ